MFSRSKVLQLNGNERFYLTNYICATLRIKLYQNILIRFQIYLTVLTDSGMIYFTSTKKARVN